MVADLHIGVLAFPFGTHAAPLLTLIRKLAASAPGIHFSFFNSAISNSTVFNAHLLGSYDNIKAYDVWDGTPEEFSGSPLEAIGLFLKASPGNFEKLIEEAEEKTGLTISCFISDAFLWFACDLAEKKGVPWVPYWTSGSCSLSAHVYAQEIVKEMGLSSPESAEEEATVSFIPGLEMVHFSDLPAEIFLDKNPSPLALTINDMVQKLPNSTAVVVNCFEEMDPIITDDLKSKFQHLLNIGPSILSSPTPKSPDDKTGCLSWLEKQNMPKSVIYIAFGSVITPPENELEALAEALETCKFPFIWSLKDHAKKFLPKGFLDRTIAFGKIVPWAPQLQVLQHNSMGLFVNHGGWNSVVESICSSVPMICRPFFGDHKLNARMVEDSWKVGVTVKGGVFTKNETIETLNSMMSSEGGKKIRENIYQLKEKAINAVEVDGSSTKNFKKLLEIISGSKCDTKQV